LIWFSFSDSTQWVGRQEGHSASKKSAPDTSLQTTRDEDGRICQLNDSKEAET